MTGATTSRRTALAMLASAFGLGPALAAAAQDYPSRPIRLIVPFPPGGPTDVVARLVEQSASPILGQPIAVENRPGGAAGTVGSRVVVSANPDGYTLLLSIAGSLAIAPALYKLDYDPLKDLAPVAIVEECPQVLTVNPALPATLASFIAYAKANRGKLDIGSPSVGTVPHVLGEYLQVLTGIKLTHVPYRGAGPAIVDLLAGQVQVMLNNPSVVLAHIKSGRLRALAVTSDQRFAQLPEVPTFRELGYPQLTATEWLGLFAPAATPQPIVDKLNRVVNQAMQPPAVQAALQKLGVESKAVTPQAFKTFVAAETRKWGQMVTRADIKVQ